MVIFDCETTDLAQPEILPLDKHPKIIEFAAIKLDDYTLEEVDRIEMIINPQMPIPAKITQITGIKDSDVKDAQPFSFHFKDIAKFFIGEKYIFAHNAAFDVYMLQTEFKRLGMWPSFPSPLTPVCTVRQTMKMRGYRLSLSVLYQQLFGDQMPKGHRAMVDVESLTRIVRELLNKEIIKLKIHTKVNNNEQ